MILYINNSPQKVHCLELKVTKLESYKINSSHRRKNFHSIFTWSARRKKVARTSAPDSILIIHSRARTRVCGKKRLSHWPRVSSVALFLCASIARRTNISSRRILGQPPLQHLGPSLLHGCPLVKRWTLPWIHYRPWLSPSPGILCPQVFSFSLELKIRNFRVS